MTSPSYDVASNLQSSSKLPASVTFRRLDIIQKSQLYLSTLLNYTPALLKRLFRWLLLLLLLLLLYIHLTYYILKGLKLINLKSVFNNLAKAIDWFSIPFVPSVIIQDFFFCNFLKLLYFPILLLN